MALTDETILAACERYRTARLSYSPTSPEMETARGLLDSIQAFFAPLVQAAQRDALPETSLTWPDLRWITVDYPARFVRQTYHELLDILVFYSAPCWGALLADRVDCLVRMKTWWEKQESPARPMGLLF